VLFISSYILFVFSAANANVIPNAVDGSTISINQTSNGTLLISWSPVTNVNFGTLSYDIRVGTVDHNGTAVIFCLSEIV